MSSLQQQIDQRQLPCVIPQINHSLFGGKYNSPFIRAYPSALSIYGIPESSFLAFVDGLNESFVTNPALETATHIGMGMSVFGGPHGHIIGKAVKMAAKTASSATSSKKTKIFLEEVNKDMFAGHGLKVQILPTYEMLQIIGCPPDQFQQAQFETADLGDTVTSQQQEYSQINRMRALNGWVQPLTYQILHSTPSSDSWSQQQAAKKAAKQHENQTEDLAKAHEKRNEKIREATTHHEKDMREYNAELAKLQEKLNDDLLKDAHSPGKQQKARQKYAEEVRKLDKDKGQGKMAEEMQDADEEVLKFQRGEGKEVRYLEWIVVTTVGWVGQVQGGHEGLRLKAGEQAKKHFIKSLFQ